MASKRTLRSVSEEEAAAAAAELEKAKAKKKTLAEAIEGGVYLEILEAQQRQMASDIKDANGPAKAAMYRQLALISKEIEQLRLVEKEEGGEGGSTGPVEDEKFQEEAI